MIPPERDFQYLKHAVSIEQVLDHRGFLGRMRVRGHQLVGPCPVHHGDNPHAFVVHRRRNLWNCFTGCAGGGDVVELVRRLDLVGYREVAEYLASLVGCNMPRLPPLPPARQSRSFRPFQARLALDPRAPTLLSRGIRPQTAAAFEAGAYHGRGMLKGCIAFRLHDSEGRPLGYAGRRLDPNEIRKRGKWVFPPRLPKRSLLYGYHRVRDRWDRGLALVECPWAVLRLTQLGVPAVALLGTALSAQQRELLEGVPCLLVMMDGDAPGREAATRLHREFRQQLHTQIVDLPEACDPDDLDDAQLRRYVRHLVPF